MANSIGKYTLIRKLAVGGMAEVFLARADGPMGFQKKVVVKRILPHYVDDPRFVEMFLGEARLAAELSHPNLVQIFDFGEVDGQYFIAMEYIDGPNLRVLNREARTHEGPLSLPLVARIIAQAAEGLHSAHELRDENGRYVNLVHRDISPDNILVSRNGAVKVVDFGIAKAANQPHLTKSGMIKGKMAYMPPEQLAREPLDRRADIFALGIVLYELVTGGMPFDATSEVSIIQAILGQHPLDRVTLHRPDVPPALDAIIARCLEKKPEARYANCRELQQDLERYIQSTGTPVGTAEIAAAVTHFFTPDTEATQPAVGVDAGLDPTSPSRPSQSRPEAARSGDEGKPSGVPTGLSHTQLKGLESGRGRGIGIAVGVVALLVAGVWAVVLLWQPPPVTKPVVENPPAAVPDAAVAVASPVVNAGAPEPQDAGTVAVAVAEGLDAGHATAVEPAVQRKAKLEFRIRPYATVYLDGKKLGDTPVDTQVVAVGKHVVRLVNEKLGKDVEIPVVVKAPETIFKHNLKE